MNAVEKFEVLLHDDTTLERDMQQFMEQNTDFVPTFRHQLHHGIWLNSVFAQPNVGPRNTDFAFLTKHTAQRRIVFIELERPGKSFLLAKKNYVVSSADLNNALDQIRAWKPSMRQNPELISVLSSLFDNAYKDVVDTKFTLVIGRTDEWASDPRRAAYVSEIERKDDIIVMGYDTIARTVRFRNSDHHLAHLFRGHLGSDDRPCLLARHVDGFTIKRLSGAPRHLLETLGAHQLHLSAEHRRLFSEAGYDMNRWERGKLSKRTMLTEAYETAAEEQLKKLIKAYPG